MAGELKDLEWIGFQQFKEASRVFVRTTEPVQYKIDTSRPGLVVLLLENTGISRRNNRRHLDTRFFDSPVGFIKPRIIEGASPTIRIEITMRQQAPYKEVQQDNFLAIDFQRP